MDAMNDRIELGCAGHFICAKDCQWRRHTQVKGYRISTVGNLYRDGKREPLGFEPDSWFETMVFTISDQPASESDGCGCCRVTDWCEVEGQRYTTAGDAQAGHEVLVEKYGGRNG